MVQKILKSTIYLFTMLFILVLVVMLCFGDKDISASQLEAQYSDSLSQYIQIMDTRVHYKREGQGMPLLLIHGTAASLHTWDAWTRLLKEHFEIIRLDLPAFGLTGPRPDRRYEIADYVSFIHAFSQTMKLDHFAIAGNSLGGCIAWNYACIHPERISKMILVDASGMPNNDTPMILSMGKTPIINNVLKHITPKSFIAKNLREVFYEDSLISDALVSRYHNMALREGNRQAFVDRCKINTTLDTSCLSRLNMPVLIQWGAYDEWIDISNAYEFAKVIPQNKLKIYESGHVPMEENPNRTAKDALSFLKK